MISGSRASPREQTRTPYVPAPDVSYAPVAETILPVESTIKASYSSLADVVATLASIRDGPLTVTRFNELQPPFGNRPLICVGAADAVSPATKKAVVATSSTTSCFARALT